MDISRQWAALVAIAAVALVAIAGCAKKEAPGPGAAIKPPATPPTAKSPAPSLPTGDAWSQMAQRRKAVSSYTMTMTIDGQAVKQSMQLDDGAPVAMKMAMGDKGWTLTQFDKKVQYVYDPQAKVAMKMSLKDMGDIKDTMDKQIDRFKEEGVKVTDDTVDGVDCWKVATKTGSAWMDKEYGLPRQMEADGKVTRLKYTAINSVPDSEFSLPAGVKVQDMGEMMKQIPKGMPTMPKGAPTSPGN